MTLYISDLDGTLLAPDGTLSARSRHLLHDALRGGAAITMASARSVVSMRQLLQGLPITLPLIGHNGAVVARLGDEGVDHVHAIPPAAVRRAFDHMQAHGHVPIVTTFVKGMEHLYAESPRNAGQRAYLAGRIRARDPRLREVPDVATILGQDVLTMTLIGEAEAMGRLQPLLDTDPAVQAHLFDDLYAPGWKWITVHPSVVSKAHAIEHLRHAHHLQDRTLLVFGDQVNDLSMFHLADHAVAVQNAAPSVKAAADEIIGSNRDDAVAEFISDHHRRSRTRPRPR